MTNSRERMLAALRRQPEDHVPCCPFSSRSLAGDRFSWVGRADTLERITGGLGLDVVAEITLAKGRPGLPNGPSEKPSAFSAEGLVLGAALSGRAHFPWENALAVFDECASAGIEPLALLIGIHATEHTIA